MPGTSWRDVAANLDARAFYEAQGVRNISGNGPFKALCPFHDDTHQSFSISTNGLFRCHACGEQGSAFDFFMRTQNVDFATAVQAVAAYAPGVRLGPTPLPVARRFNPAQAEAWAHALANTPDVMSYLLFKRGLTEDTITRFGLGWTGTRISIPIRDAAGNVVNAKLYKPNGDAGDKMRWAVPGTPAPLFIPPIEMGEGEVLLVEGEFDCMLAIQHGFNAQTGTAGAMTWKKEWNDVFAGRVVVILYDKDEAGAKGAAAAAQALSSVRAKVRVAAWPEDADGGFDCTDWYAGQGRSDEELRALLAGAVPHEGPSPERVDPPAHADAGAGAPGDGPHEPPIPFSFENAPALVALVDPSTKPVETMAHLRKWYPAMSRWSNAEVRLFYTSVIPAHFVKYNRHTIQALMQDALEYKRDDERRRKAGMSVGQSVVVKGESDEYVLSDFKHMDLGQAWLNGTMYYTVTRGVIVKEMTQDFKEVERPAFQPVFISKDGLMLADATELAKEKFYLNGVKPHVNFNESWLSDPRVPFSWGWYLRNTEKKAEVDPVALYNDIRKVFSSYVYMADDAMYDVLASYVMLSYVFKVFRSLGYLWLRALRGSGKSRVLDILHALGFNATKVVESSDSFVFRKLAATAGMVIVDEAENLKDAEERASLRRMLNSGYQAGNFVGRIEKTTDGEMRSVEFDLYGPKVLASINDPEATLADRCIVYDMERSPKNLPDFVSERSNKKWEALRNRLHCFGLFYATEVDELREQLSLDDDGNPQSLLGSELAETLRNRDRQVWTPLLTMALLIDLSTDVTSDQPLFHKVLDFARSYVLRKEQQIAEESEFQVVMGLRHYVRTHPSEDGWYNSADLLKHIRSIEGVFERFSAKRLSSIIFNKLKLGDPKVDRKKRTGRRAMFYHLDAERLEAKCRSYMLPEEDVLSFREDPDGAPPSSDEPDDTSEDAPEALRHAW